MSRGHARATVKARDPLPFLLSTRVGLFTSVRKEFFCSNRIVRPPEPIAFGRPQPSHVVGNLRQFQRQFHALLSGNWHVQFIWIFLNKMNETVLRLWRYSKFKSVSWISNWKRGKSEQHVRQKMKWIGKALSHRDHCCLLSVCQCLVAIWGLEGGGEVGDKGPRRACPLRRFWSGQKGWLGRWGLVIITCVTRMSNGSATEAHHPGGKVSIDLMARALCTSQAPPSTWNGSNWFSFSSDVLFIPNLTKRLHSNVHKSLQKLIWSKVASKINYISFHQHPMEPL